MINDVSNNNSGAPGAPPPSTILPAYPEDTADFYDRLLEPGTLGVVGAMTGGFKTGFLCNVVAHAAMAGRRVGIVCLDMRPRDIWWRLYSILANAPADDEEALRTRLARPADGDELAKAVLQTALAINCLDYTIKGATPAGLSLDLPGFAQNLDVLIVDGLDAVDTQRGLTADIETVMGVLARLAAAMPDLVLLTTSQIRREAADVEIVRLDDLAITSQKGNRVSSVITLGQRVPGALWTACVGKDRQRGVSADRQVFRFVLRPSLRFELLPVEDFELPLDQDPAMKDAFEFLGPAADLPAAEKDVDEDEGTDADEPVADIDLPHSTNRPWHGAKGFVGFGRALFHSNLFRAGHYEHWYWLSDLYAQAHFESDPAVMMAPGTKVDVKFGRGEVMVSLEMLAKRWVRTVKVVRTFLARAEKDGLIKVWHVLVNGERISARGMRDGTPMGIRKRRVATVITLCHYEAKQQSRKGGSAPEGHNDGHADGHARGTQRARRGHTTE